MRFSDYLITYLMLLDIKFQKFLKCFPSSPNFQYLSFARKIQNFTFQST